MDTRRTIVVADRSELAGNFYRLLFFPLDPAFVLRKRFEEARPHFFRKGPVHLAVFNSNIFGKRFAEYLRRFTEDEPLRAVPKIFICREGETERPWREGLLLLPRSSVITRPFHPAALLGLAKSAMEGDGR